MPKQITNNELDKRLALIEQKVADNHRALLHKFDSGWDLIVEKLKPLEDLKKKVDSHDKQISRWKGATATAMFIFSLLLAYFGIHLPRSN